VVEPVLAADTPLPWSAGAHRELHLGEHVRQYSLCGRPSESTYRVAILKEEDGRGGSAWAHERLHVLDSQAVSGPRTHIELEAAAAYVFVAGGIGITPLLPMIAAAETAGAAWVLLYGGRTRASMAYLDELAAYGEKVQVRPQDEHGLLDLASVLGVPRENTLIYTCGPEPLLSAVEAAAALWPKGALHLERFAAKEVEHDADTAFEVVFERSGVTAEVPAGTSVLDVAADHGIFVLKSCSEGVCGTCETLVLDGEPEHRDSVYTEDDHAEGAFAPCVSRCRSGRLVLDL
jgi:ferredoxin-NADP reductase